MLVEVEAVAFKPGVGSPTGPGTTGSAEAVFPESGL
jgi:hypothetical protein